MMTALTCSEVRRESVDGKEYVVVIASREDRASGSVVPVDTSALAKARAALSARRVVLGRALPAPSQRLRDESSFSHSAVHLTASDGQGVKRHLIADRAEEYSLSSGSTLCRLYIPAFGEPLNWLVGQTIEIGAARPATEAVTAVK